MSFKKVGESKKRLYGPRCLLVCGYAVDEREKVKQLLCEKTFDQIPVVFSTVSDREILVKTLVVRSHLSGADQPCSLDRAIIMSGVTEQELHYIMAEYKKTDLPRPMWAALTPTSENWTIAALVAELASERRAMPHS